MEKNTILLTFSSGNPLAVTNLGERLRNIFPEWAQLNGFTYVIRTEKDVNEVRDLARMVLISGDDRIFAVNIHGRNWSAFLPERINNFLSEVI